MIRPEQLKEILNWTEDRPIDFKRDPYRLGNDHLDSELIKDILSMANTPREDKAYIILGVKAFTDGHKDFPGVSEHPDDNDLQTKFNRAKAEPRPQFIYQPVTLDGKSYGVIEIPVQKDGPYFPTQDIGTVKAHRLYFRSGTTNKEATIHEKGNVYRWFHGTQDKRVEVAQTALIEPSRWDEFFSLCHCFETNRHYLIVVGSTSSTVKEQLSSIGNLPISMILDFDESTDQGGLYSVASPSLKNRRSVHLLTLDSKSVSVPGKACYWYACRGLQGRPSSLISDDWKQWNRRAGTRLFEVMNEFAQSSGGRPVTLVCLWYAPEYVREVCSIVDRSFGDVAEYIFAIEDANRLRELAQQFGGKLVSITMSDVLNGIQQNISVDDADLLLTASVPGRDGRFHVLSPETLRWLSEDFDVVHSNVELVPEAEREDGSDFLRGRTITWSDLRDHKDAERDNTLPFQEQIDKELSLRTTTRFNLYHWPGAGGTTMARRIAWQLRRKYPTILLCRATRGETVGRLRQLFALTTQPILAVVEAADVSPSAMELLFNEVKGENIPVVFLTVIRRFDSSTHDERSRGARTVFLGQALNVPEGHRFVQAYKKLVPGKEKALRAIVGGPPQARTPFQFALIALERNFSGINRYVSARLETATPIQRKLLLFLSLAYYYGHKPMLAQFFCAFLGRPENKVLHLKNILDVPQQELLVEEQECIWRPSHQLIAEEILQTLLSGESEEGRNWKWGLTNVVVDFINACQQSSLIPGHDLLDLMKRVMILRDERELLGTESAGMSSFARLIDDIPSIEGRLVVLKELVKNFPREAHFWAHLGRFYSITMNEPTEAIRAIDKAIELDEKDSVLFHMKGMCFRQIAYEHIKKFRDTAPTQDDMLVLRETVENAKSAFEEARDLDENSEHAHISPVQLLLRVLDFGYKYSGHTTRANFLTAPASKWYREQLDEVEYLLDRARSLREGEKLSQYVLQCQASLDEMYDDYARALEGWNNLLSRRDVFAPPVRRQITRAYVAKHGRDWSKLRPNEVERITELMEDNMREEPSSTHNIRIWFRAYRMSRQQDIDVALSKISNWRALGDSIDSYYYLYVLHILKAMDGSSVERLRAQDLIQQCKLKARILRNRTVSFEWYGKGTGLQRLKNYSELGTWSEDSDFYANESALIRVEGVVTSLDRPEAGTIELSSAGLNIFFVPARAGMFRGKDENSRVTFFLGFSYDGLRAWNIKRA